MGYTRLYLKFAKLRFFSQTESRMGYLLHLASMFMVNTGEFVLLWVMVNRFNTINGWTAYEVLLMYSLNLTSYAMASCFFYNPFRHLLTRIRTGQLDEVMTKPMNPLMYLIASNFGFGYISHLTLSVSVMCYTFFKLGITLSFIGVLLLLSFLFGAALLQASLHILTNVSAFWRLRSDNFMSLVYEFKGFTKYPISIYPFFIRFTLTWVIPFAFISYYPAEYLLGKTDGTLFHPIVPLLTPVVGLVVFGISLLYWKLGLSQYQSAGA